MTNTETQVTSGRVRGALPLAVAICVASLAVPSICAAQDRVGRGEASNYALEVEPHFAFGADNVYGSSGVGAGLRLGVPLATGFLGSVPQNVAVSFGGDILHYQNCYFADYCSANYLVVPLALQWNVFVARRVSLFAEGGAFLYKGWFDECAPGDGGCSAPPDFGVLPTLALGARVNFTPHVALALRLGYPTSTVGVSFM